MRIEEQGGTVTLDNGLYRAVLVPKHGGKVKSLVSLRTGREFLYQDSRRPEAGLHGYEAFDRSGWDECFPNIRPCDYPLPPYAGRKLPDHGWLWSRSCDYEIREGAVRMRADFPDFGLGLTREFRFVDERTVRMDYHLANGGEGEFRYLTDAHMLFCWEEGLKVTLPEQAKTLYVYRSSRPRDIKPGTTVPADFWTTAEPGFNCKVFTPPLQTGDIVLQYPGDAGAGEAVRLRFPTDSLPYAGLWIANRSPDERGNVVHCFSVQPTNFASATLPPPEWAGNLRFVAPGASVRWHIELAMEPIG